MSALGGQLDQICGNENLAFRRGHVCSDPDRLGSALRPERADKVQ